MHTDPSRKAFPLSENAQTVTLNGVAYQFITTEDGSPSIRMWGTSSDGTMPPEAMHHCAGALSESLYIYGSLLEGLRAHGWWPPRILSIGLGCGYNEWIALAMMLHLQHSRNGHTAESADPCLYLESFEADSHLRETFQTWLIDKNILHEQITDPFSILFNDVLTRIAAHFELEAEQLKNWGRELYEGHQWIVRDRLDSKTHFERKFNAIFFDAFSTKANPKLWSDEFFDGFFLAAADVNCGFSTYAATGRLNRALKRAGFTLVPCQGFSGKRESTRAFR